MEPADLAHFPDDKRAQIESWWAHYRDPNVSPLILEEFAYFLDAPTTSEEVAAFLSPFDCADELVASFNSVWQNWGVKREAPSEATLIAALQDYVNEMVRNALVVG